MDRVRFARNDIVAPRRDYHRSKFWSTGMTGSNSPSRMSKYLRKTPIQLVSRGTNGTNS